MDGTMIKVVLITINSMESDALIGPMIWYVDMDKKISMIYLSLLCCEWW